MYEIQRIQQIAQQKAKEHPELANEILESARMSLTEIAAGESPHHELELFESHIKELTD